LRSLSISTVFRKSRSWSQFCSRRCYCLTFYCVLLQDELSNMCSGSMSNNGCEFKAGFPSELWCPPMGTGLGCWIKFLNELAMFEFEELERGLF